MGAGMTRRAFVCGLPAVAVAASPGCKTLPGMEAVELAARGIGGAAGLVLNDCSLSPETRRTLACVMERIVAITPGAGESLTETWTTEAKKHVDGLVAGGKCRPLVGAVALAAFAVVVRAYVLLELRYPEIRVARELAFAAVDGFAAGFLATFRPSGLAVQAYDVAVYRELSASAEAMALRNLAAVVAEEGGK